MHIRIGRYGVFVRRDDEVNISVVNGKVRDSILYQNVRSIQQERKVIIKKKVNRALERWYRAQKFYSANLESEPSVADDNTDILQHMPRTAVIEPENSYIGPPPRALATLPQASILDTLKRLLVWLSAILYFVRCLLWDFLRQRRSRQNNAKHLRETFQRAGGTLIKFGQQMSIRLDLLPYEYCMELAQLLDKVAPMHPDEAIRAIEQSFKKPLNQVFSQFDPVPIGSASIACVYQAVLLSNGQKVAVKVRRPNIDRIFAADFNVFDWLLGIVEWLTIIPQGLTGNVRQELRSAFGSELDFRREARFQEIFINNSINATKKVFTAPRVYFQYTTSEVLVQEFVSGVWLSEVLAALEEHNPKAQAKLKEYNINPVIVAQNILYANYWGFFENIAFHADPHPANLLVGEDNMITFIDFGASGTIDYVRRVLYQKLFDSQANDDAWGMVQAALGLLEPLPNIDVTGFAKELEAAFYENLFAFKSDHAYWYERTTANVWLSFLTLIRRYNIVPPLDILMFARSSLLYDTLAARLAPDIDFWAEFQEYIQDVHRKTQKRYQKMINKRLREGLQAVDFALIELLSDVGVRSLYQVRRYLSQPNSNILKNYTVDRVYYIASKFMGLVVQIGFLTLLGVVMQLIEQRMVDTSLNLQVAVMTTIQSIWYIVVIVILCLLFLRRVAFRAMEQTV